MKSIGFLATTALATSMLFSTAAFAQESTPESDAPTSPTAVPAPPAADDSDTTSENSEDESGNQIIVTGTRIARPTLESTVPLTSVTVDDLTGTGETSLGDALNDLPSLRSTFSSGNSSRFIGTAGLSLLDLRGLGTDRTLVLVNGRRHVTSSPGDVGFDVNTIPTDLVDRIDIVTGGNSAIYGSDAVAGVVNFVLKRDFDGYKVNAQAGISSRGDRGTRFVSGLFGRNFGDGRGNIALALEYTGQDELLFRDRDKLTGAFSGRCQFQLTDPQGVAGGEVGFSATDGIPDNTFLCGIRNATISSAGTVGGIGGGRFLRFDNQGNLFIDIPTQDFGAVGSGNQQGGNGATLRGTGSLLAKVDRYAANLLLHYDFSEAFKPFLEAKYVRTDVSGEGQPSFFTSVPGTLGGPAFRCNNGFLGTQALTTLQSFGLCLTPATGTFPLARFNDDFGGRGFEGRRETYRAVAGIEGSFNDDWRYEVAFNYGRFEAFGRNDNNLIIFNQAGTDFDGFNRAVDAVVAPGTFTGTNFVLNGAGQRVICRVNSVTNVDPNCFPVNVFGQFQADPRALDYINTSGTTEEFASQMVVSAFVSGDFSQLFELPGGPISFAVGAEYRKEKASVDFDDLTSSGATFLNALQDFRPPNLSVKEVYGELQFPILKDLSFAKELSINLAGRISDYNNSTGTVKTYNIQGIYAPVEDIRFRAAYATSVRAPTQGDLFSPLSENFAQIADPCDSLNINLGPNRAANCAAFGVPTTNTPAVVAACLAQGLTVTPGAPFANCTARVQTTGFVSGGNPTLVAEKGRSITVGAVIQPRWIPGLEFTVDYYNIRVKNLIAALGAQAIISNCFDSPAGPSSPFCTTVSRDPASGLFLEPAVISGGVNFAAQKTRGLDFDLTYRKTFDNGHKVRLSVLATRVLELNNFTDPQFSFVPNRQLSELGDPKWAGSLLFDYDFGDFDFRYAARYIGRQTIGTYEAQNTYIGRCPTTGAFAGQTGIGGGTCTPGELARLAPLNADQFPRVYYPDVFYHDIRIGFDVNRKFRFYGGVNNLFDREPPLGLLGTAGGDPFDSFGRNFFFGITANF